LTSNRPPARIASTSGPGRNASGPWAALALAQRRQFTIEHASERALEQLAIEQHHVLVVGRHVPTHHRMRDREPTDLGQRALERERGIVDRIVTREIRAHERLHASPQLGQATQPA
jgi:hypothetical protein